MNKKIIIAENIKKIREGLDLSQQEVADALNMSRTTYSDIERSIRDVTATEIKELCDFFGITLEDIFDEPAPKNRAKVIKQKNITFSEEKLKNTLLYFLEKCGGKPNVGETLIYKLLYFVDFDHFEVYGEPITGLSYINQKFGPVPLQSQYNPIISKMKDSLELKIFLQDYHGKKQKRYVALNNYKIDSLTEREKNTIDSVINRYSDMSATSIANFVHLDVPWRETSNKDVIPYSLALKRKPPFSKKNTT